MSDPEKKTCSRPGCGKKLYASNSTGMCASGCFSDEAPAAIRAKGPRQEGRLSAPKDVSPKRAAAPKRKKASEDVIASFRAVATGLGRDPDEEIEKFCSAWLDALRERLA